MQNSGTKVMVALLKGNFFRGLLIADKSGDVYLFNTEGEKEGHLLLGET